MPPESDQPTLELVGALSQGTDFHGARRIAAAVRRREGRRAGSSPSGARISPPAPGGRPRPRRSSVRTTLAGAPSTRLRGGITVPGVTRAAAPTTDPCADHRVVQDASPACRSGSRPRRGSRAAWPGGRRRPPARRRRGCRRPRAGRCRPGCSIRAPTVTGARSPRSTAPYQIETSSPRRTSPTTAAPGQTSTRSPSDGSVRQVAVDDRARGSARAAPPRAHPARRRPAAGRRRPSTDVVLVAIAPTAPDARRRSGGDEPQLAQPRRRDRRRSGYSFEKQASQRPWFGSVDGALADGGVQALERQVAERVGADELADLVDRLGRGDQLLARAACRCRSGRGPRWAAS